MFKEESSKRELLSGCGHKGALSESLGNRIFSKPTFCGVQLADEPQGTPLRYLENRGFAEILVFPETSKRHIQEKSLRPHVLLCPAS